MVRKKAIVARNQKRQPRSSFQPELDRKADKSAKQAGKGSTLGMFAHNATKARGGR